MNVADKGVLDIMYVTIKKTTADAVYDLNRSAAESCRRYKYELGIRFMRECR